MNNFLTLLAVELKGKVCSFKYSDFSGYYISRFFGLYRESLPRGLYATCFLANQYARNKSIPFFTRIIDYGADLPFRFKFLTKVHQTWIVDLEDDSAKFEQKLGCKTRNQIRKSMKDGINTRKANISDLNDIICLYKQLCIKHGIRKPYSLDFFASLLNESQNEGSPIWFYITKQEQKTCSYGIFIYLQNNELLYWLAANDGQYNASCPQYNLLHTVIDIARKNGVYTLNLGAIPEENTTLHKFKKNWAASPRLYKSYWTLL